MKQEARRGDSGAARSSHPPEPLSLPWMDCFDPCNQSAPMVNATEVHVAVLYLAYKRGSDAKFAHLWLLDRGE